ncbi:haloacid dehalogenase type II [Salinibacterium sp. M195]|uniref:haloacid dehalogenase type II n=1 Tax=Salinibacterium sp. M195 TaxID=2583374 RepID=UPI001C62EEDE|nr:haloacid dehalogenase type II [Salinibacterium sp. M195]QYH36007.1 haloacid dehalogenase type II [Salinibacterium sp. M195]
MMNNSTVTIFFDVNETLSNLKPVSDAFDAAGAPHGLATMWFATVLRDGFALAATGSTARFLDIATTNAHSVLRDLPLTHSLDESVDAVLSAFAQVHVHDDVPAGIRALHGAGHRLFTLSNGPTATAQRLFEAAGVSDLIDGVLSVEGHAPWKPARGAYEDALTRTGTTGTAYLVAVHPWDIHGAAMAGLSTVWVNRTGATYPEHFLPPTTSVTSLDGLAAELR